MNRLSMENEVGREEIWVRVPMCPDTFPAFGNNIWLIGEEKRVEKPLAGK